MKRNRMGRISRVLFLSPGDACEIIILAHFAMPPQLRAAAKRNPKASQATTIIQLSSPALATRILILNFRETWAQCIYIGTIRGDLKTSSGGEGAAPTSRSLGALLSVRSNLGLGAVAGNVVID